MQYLLKGGEFNNKGSEAMTLTAISHIVANDKNAKIILIDYATPNLYSFSADVSTIYIPPFIVHKMLGKYSVSDLYLEVKDFIKFFIPGRISTVGKKRQLRERIKQIDTLIDISGFAVSSQWNDQKSVEFCEWINLIKQNGGKVFIMPQSFGPFNYNNESTLKYVKESLPLCDLIYAREKKGYDELVKMGLSNVKLSPDSVLLEKKLDVKQLIRNYNDFDDKFDMKSDCNIGLIPNMRLVDSGNIKLAELLDFYCGCISRASNYNFYLLAHAGEDLEICRQVKEYFKNDDRVVFVDHVLTSFSYERLARDLSFIVASRYHSIIHSYKETTPAVILGWSEKYNEVANLFDQNSYLTNTECLEEAYSVFDAMMSNHVKERALIGKKLIEIQKNCCYSFLESMVQYED